MKTKLNFKIDAIQFEINGTLINTPQIDIATDIETTVGELKELYNLKKTVLQESPALIEDLMQKFMSLHKTSVGIVKNVEEEELNQAIVKEAKEKAKTENEMLDRWFKEVCADVNLSKQITRLFNNYCDEINIGKTNLRNLYGLSLFFRLSLEQKQGFAKRVTEHITMGF